MFFRPEMVAVEGGVVFYEPCNASRFSSIEFLNLTDYSLQPIGQLLFGRSSGVAFPVHGLTCHEEEEEENTTIGQQE